MTLPAAPTPDQFESQDDFQEALGFWQQRVGRIKGMVERAKQTAASSGSPDASASSPPAPFPKLSA